MKYCGQSVLYTYREGWVTLVHVTSRAQTGFHIKLVYCLGAGTPEALEDVFQAGRYVYMEDLKMIASRKPKEALVVPPQLQAIHTPLRLSSWQQYLEGHPDSEFVTFLLEGISNGFRIGFNYGSHQCRAANRNMQSAIQNPQEVDKYFTKECEKGRIIGPLEKGSFSLHINWFGVIPKPHQLGKWRLIVDMSYPDKASVNEGIDPSLCPCRTQPSMMQ